MQGLGFAQVIPAAQLAIHIARIRSEGFPEYTVNPPGERAIYTLSSTWSPFVTVTYVLSVTICIPNRSGERYGAGT